LPARSRACSAASAVPWVTLGCWELMPDDYAARGTAPRVVGLAVTGAKVPGG
jgi:hypothetical protein